MEGKISAFPKKKKMNLRQKKEAAAAYLFLAPAALGLIVFIFIPTIVAFGLSFFDWNLTGKASFVGVENYNTAFHDPLFYNSIKVTLQYMVFYIPPSLVISFFMAVAMRQKIKGKVFFRTAFVIPWITTPIIISYIWSMMLDGTFGVINYISKSMGFNLMEVFSAKWWPMASIVIVYLWIYCGYNMMIFTAGLGDIPASLYEAAKIDGANAAQRMFKITLPLMRPTFMFVMITSIIGSFQVFDLAYGMYQGGPGDATRTYYYVLYNNAFKYFKMGYASALAVILFVVLVIVTLVQYKLFSHDMTLDYSS